MDGENRKRSLSGHQITESRLSILFILTKIKKIPKNKSSSSIDSVFMSNDHFFKIGELKGAGL
jgi:hypothetical protein